jgi:hypothetical protein
MVAAWESGWYWLAAGQSDTYWVSWGDTWQGLQFIMAEPRGGGQTQMYVTSYGIQIVPRIGLPPRFSYWVDVVNRGPAGSNFVLRGQRVD